MVHGGEFLKVLVVYAVINWGGTRGPLLQNSFNKPRGEGDISKGSMLAWLGTGITCSIHDESDE